MAYSTRLHGIVNTDLEIEKGQKPIDEREKTTKPPELIDI